MPHKGSRMERGAMQQSPSRQWMSYTASTCPDSSMNTAVHLTGTVSPHHLALSADRNVMLCTGVVVRNCKSSEGQTLCSVNWHISQFHLPSTERSTGMEFCQAGAQNISSNIWSRIQTTVNKLLERRI